MKISIPIFLVLCTLSGCGGHKSAEYDVTFINVTAGQPLSPPRLLLHEAGHSLWQIGHPASDALEKLAESGDSSMLTLPNTADHAQADAPLLPGASMEFVLKAGKMQHPELSVATMLVNTNDAFAGVSNLDLSHMGKGDTLMLTAPIYDAGTEANSESLADIPGPAAGGEGYNAERNDVNYVAYHPGVVTAADGLMSSVLDGQHKFDQGAVTIRIYRRQ